MPEASAVSVTTGANANAGIPPSTVSADNQQADTASPDARSEQAAEDDAEVDIFGEKIKKSEYKRLREIEKNRRQFDAAAHKKFEDAAKLRKETEQKHAVIGQLEQRAKQGDKRAAYQLLEVLGYNPDEIAEARLTESLERAKMSPEQVAWEQKKAEQDSREEVLREREDQQKQQYHQALTQQWVQQFDQVIGTAMSKHRLPKTPHTVTRMADELSKFVERGQPIDGDLAAEIVRDEQVATVQQILEAIESDEDFQAALGSKALTRAQKIQLARAVAVQQPKQRQADATGIFNKKTKEPMTFEQVRKRLGTG